VIEKLTHVPIVVSSQERALEFYTKLLGFEKRADYQQPGNPRWLTVAPKGTDVELILFEGKYKLDPRLPPEAGHGGNHWVFKTDDCRKDFEILKARGVKFKDPAPVEANFGIAAYFTDPDGNHLTLLESSAGPSRKG
jgi:catechol 2,3-dioxygenase-like lactoylglutathione lyase family enzyme